jgi:hypothetical protein
MHCKIVRTQQVGLIKSRMPPRDTISTLIGDSGHVIAPGLLIQRISNTGLAGPILWLAVRSFGNVRREALQNEFADEI